MILSSTKSTRTSLESIRSGEDGLNEKRRTLLERIPKTSDWARFSKNSIKNKDLAYLSAATGHEFALLRGKKADILFHGNKLHCDFDDVLVDMLYDGKLKLVCHSHPGEEYPVPSDDDSETLVIIGQSSSIIISGITGIEVEFYV